MYTKPKLAIKHQVEDLICFIEKNDFDNFKKIVEEYPKIIKKTKMDDYEPIIYAVRYGHFKIFKFLIDTMKENNIEIDTQKLTPMIFKSKHKKIFRYYWENSGLNITMAMAISFQYQNQGNDKPTLHNSIIQSNKDLVEILLTELNFSYKFIMDRQLADFMGYNSFCIYRGDCLTNVEKLEVEFINEDESTLKQPLMVVEKKEYLLKFNKVFVTMRKAVKRFDLQDSDFNEILKYI